MLPRTQTDIPPARLVELFGVRKRLGPPRQPLHTVPHGTQEHVVILQPRQVLNKSYYSVPPDQPSVGAHLGRTLWVRWDKRLVRVFNERMEVICTHVRKPEGQFSTLPEHLASEKISPVEQGMEWLLKKVGYVGPHTRAWSLGLVGTRGIEAVRVLHGLLNLTNKHPSEVLERACETAHSYGEYRLKTLRQLIEHAAPKQQAFEFIDEHPMIRNLSDYGLQAEPIAEQHRAAQVAKTSGYGHAIGQISDAATAESQAACSIGGRLVA